jgi:hypothetical protein
MTLSNAGVPTELPNVSDFNSINGEPDTSIAPTADGYEDINWDYISKFQLPIQIFVDRYSPVVDVASNECRAREGVEQYGKNGST